MELLFVCVLALFFSCGAALLQTGNAISSLPHSYTYNSLVAIPHLNGVLSIGGIGENGIEATERFIRHAVNYLLPDGRLYIVASSLADILAIEKVMKSCYLVTEVVGETPLFYEKLQILRGTLKK